MATSMTSEEVREFLRTQRTLILSTLKRDGAPVSHALWFIYLDDAVYFDTQSASFKARNIRRDPRVCCLVEAGETYFALRGVMIQGRCVPVEDSEEIGRVEAAAAEKSARIGSGIEELPRWFGESRKGRRERGGRAMFKVPMERVTTWNFGQARDHYARIAERGGSR
jgi:nitroimidazol reductase NimA-like FMN-containing flavoprotein (pyridoxamine 5'-phosphate oxidase superfamily)